MFKPAMLLIEGLHTDYGTYSGRALMTLHIQTLIMARYYLQISSLILSHTLHVSDVMSSDVQRTAVLQMERPR